MRFVLGGGGFSGAGCIIGRSSGVVLPGVVFGLIDGERRNIGGGIDARAGSLCDSGIVANTRRSC